MTVQEERNEYMRNVKWTTAGIVFSSTVSLIVGLVWFCSDIKGSIKDVSNAVKDARTEAREQLTAAVTSINRRIDSNEFHHKNDIQAIWVVLNGNKQPQQLQQNLKFYTEKKVNGKVVLVAVN